VLAESTMASMHQPAGAQLAPAAATEVARAVGRDLQLGLLALVSSHELVGAAVLY